MISFSQDQKVAYETIAKWLANGGIVNKKQKDPKLLTLGGFAGTGKTTLVSEIAKDFGTAIRFAFCALSGRASSILGNKLREGGLNTGESGHYCGTIHGLIYQPIENEDGEIIYWQKLQKIDYDVIVLDEASMISEDIFKDLYSYGIDILAIGDHGQLPPIEGRFSLMKDPHIRLEKIHRQARDNPIIDLSVIVRENGRIPNNYEDNKNVKIIKKKDYIDLLRFTFKKQQDPNKIIDTAVLCYTNATRNKLNIMIRNMIFGSVNRTPMTNDIVICLRNSKRRKQPIYNGFRGYLISGVKNYDEHTWSGKINFPYENLETYIKRMCKHQFGYPKTFSSFSELEKFGMKVKIWSAVGMLIDYGYAMTVHKAQGSQMNNVIVYNERPAPVSEDNYRRWIYTAISRSSKNLIIIT